MYFSKKFAAIGATLLFVSANAGVIQQRAMTAPQIVVNIDALTSLSQSLQGPASNINLLSGILFLIGLGPFPTIILGFSQIIQTVTVDIGQMQGTQPFSLKSDEKLIVGALTTFVKVHQQLLNILIGKAGLLNVIPLVGTPIAQILRQLESVVDTVAYGLINICPDFSDQLTGQMGSLDVTIGDAITAYNPLV